MALNIAMPLSGVSDFLEGFGLLSPISPISVDCREHLKLLVSPIDSESSGISSLDSEESKEKKTPIKIEEDCKIYYNGKNILDLVSTLTDNKRWNIIYSELPENNFQMFLANRSQYHRLGTNGHIQEYSLNKCQCCDFKYPVNNYSYNITGAVVAASSNLNNNNNNTTNNNNNINANTASSVIGKNNIKIDKNMNIINHNFNNNNNNNNSNNIRLYRQF